MSKTLYLISAGLALCLQTNAQISLVKNMQAGDILEIKQSGNQLFYTTAGPTPTLWVSDGTQNGTNPVASFGQSINGLTAYNNHIYFVTSDTSGYRQLYVSDGTAANTKVVKKINPTGNSFDRDTLFWQPNIVERYSNYSEYMIRVMNGKMYFMASDGVHGRELWTSDGTAAGTTMVKDINSAAGIGNYPAEDRRTSFEVMNNKLYFYASDGGVQEGLWASDGTSAGTVFVKRISASSFYATADRLFFTGWCLDSACTVHGIYLTDGTDTGTHLILPETSFGNVDEVDYAKAGNDVYFMTRRDSNSIFLLYKTDGTAAGTVLLKDHNFSNAGALTVYNRHPFYLTALNNKAYFALDEPWMSDGTVAGTKILKDLTPYTRNGYQVPSFPGRFTVVGNQMFFKARDTLRADVWVSDGTDTGTWKITDSGSNYNSGNNMLANLFSIRSPMIPFASSLYFSNFYDTTIKTAFYKLGLNPTSVANLSSNVKAITLFPNPASQTVSVKGVKVQEFIISDITGKIVQHTNGSDALVSGLPSGMYIATIIATDGTRYAGKFIKQ